MRECKLAVDTQTHLIICGLGISKSDFEEDGSVSRFADTKTYGKI